jgi:trehalose 6-phosphate phosphatase
MLPSALDHVSEVAGARQHALAIFLDYDGTLTPIMSRPEQAVLSDSMRTVLRALATKLPVAILSGRDLDDVRQRVGIDAIVYAGSHGFDIAGPRGLHRQMGTEFLPNLGVAEKELHDVLDRIPGAFVERKHFSIAAHYRNVKENEASKVEQAVKEVAGRHPELRRIDGKKVYELLPNVDWDKGKAVLWLLRTLDPGGEKDRPIYIGDDRTDEDAFRVLELEQRGVGIVVTEYPRQSAASYMLKDSNEVELFLLSLIARM